MRTGQHARIQENPWQDKQNTIFKSSAEAEYRAMAQATCDIVWAIAVIEDFGVEIEKAIPLYCDNQSTIYICFNLVFHERTKHIEIDYHTVREKYLKGIIKPLHIRNKL